MSSFCSIFLSFSGVLSIWHNESDMIFPQIESLAYENAVPNFPDTALHFGYFMKVVLGTFKDYYAIVTALSSGNEIEIN